MCLDFDSLILLLLIFTVVFIVAPITLFICLFLGFSEMNNRNKFDSKVKN